MYENFIKPIREYAFAAGPLNYALMLNGPWGSGKTHFIKHQVISDLKEKCPQSGETRDFQTIYLSLNGVSSTFEIDDQLSISLFAHANQSEAKILGRFARSIAGLWKNKKNKELFNSADNFTEVIQKGLIKKSDLIVIFDDIERCKIPINELFGYINDFVEHFDKRVILICDEERMELGASEDPSNRYKSTREKLVGLTIKFDPDTESIVEAAISYTATGQAKSYLTQSKSLLIKLFNSMPRKNIRALKFGLRAFCKAHKAIEDKNIEDLYKRSFLRFLLGFSFETSAGKDAQYILDSLNLNPLLYTTNSRKSEADADSPKAKKHKYMRDFHARYYETGAVFYFFKSGYKLLQNGLLDKELLFREFQIKGEPTDTESFLTFSRSYPSLPESEFKETSEKILSSVSSGQLESPDMYIHALALFSSLIDKSLHKASLAETTELIKKGFKKALDGGSFDKERVSYFVDHYSFGDSYGGREPVDEFANFIFQSCVNSRNSTIAEELSKATSDLKKLIELMTGLNAVEGVTRLVFAPIFNKIDPEELASSILGAENASLTGFESALRQRYRHADIRTIFGAERDNIEKLIEKLSVGGVALEESRILAKYNVRRISAFLSEVLTELSREGTDV